MVQNAVLGRTCVVVNVETVTKEKTRSELNTALFHFFEFFQFIALVINRGFTNGPTMCTPFLPFEFAICVADGRVSCADVTLAGAALAEQSLCKSLLVNFKISEAVVFDAFA